MKLLFTISIGDEFHTVGLSKANKPCPNNFAKTKRMPRNFLLEEENKFHVGLCIATKENKIEKYQERKRSQTQKIYIQYLLLQVTN